MMTRKQLFDFENKACNGDFSASEAADIIERLCREVRDLHRIQRENEVVIRQIARDGEFISSGSGMIPRG